VAETKHWKDWVIGVLLVLTLSVSGWAWTKQTQTGDDVRKEISGGRSASATSCLRPPCVRPAVRTLRLPCSLRCFARGPRAALSGVGAFGCPRYRELGTGTDGWQNGWAGGC
jgi:hypothetical protein